MRQVRETCKAGSSVNKTKKKNVGYSGGQGWFQVQIFMDLYLEFKLLFILVLRPKVLEKYQVRSSRLHCIQSKVIYCI